MAGSLDGRKAAIPSQEEVYVIGAFDTYGSVTRDPKSERPLAKMAMHRDHCAYASAVQGKGTLRRP